LNYRFFRPFQFFDPTVLLYDNLKSAVLERHGDAIRFHPTLLAFAAHYRFEPRPVVLARGNEKGSDSYCTSSAN
jgi:transposase